MRENLGCYHTEWMPRSWLLAAVWSLIHEFLLICIGRPGRLGRLGERSEGELGIVKEVIRLKRLKKLENREIRSHTRVEYQARALWIITVVGYAKWQESCRRDEAQNDMKLAVNPSRNPLKGVVDGLRNVQEVVVSEIDSYPSIILISEGDITVILSLYWLHFMLYVVILERRF